MKLYFIDRDKKEILVNDDVDRNTYVAAMRKYLKGRNIEMTKYWREWEESAPRRIVIDFGSWSEFFVLVPEDKNEIDEDKFYLVSHPYCVRCQQEGVFKDSKKVWRGPKEPEALCENCYDEAEFDYLLCKYSF